MLARVCHWLLFKITAFLLCIFVLKLDAYLSFFKYFFSWSGNSIAISSNSTRSVSKTRSLKDCSDRSGLSGENFRHVSHHIPASRWSIIPPPPLQAHLIKLHHSLTAIVKDSNVSILHQQRYEVTHLAGHEKQRTTERLFVPFEAVTCRYTYKCPNQWRLKTTCHDFTLSHISENAMIDKSLVHGICHDRFPDIKERLTLCQ